MVRYAKGERLDLESSVCGFESRLHHFFSHHLDCALVCVEFDPKCVDHLLVPSTIGLSWNFSTLLICFQIGRPMRFQKHLICLAILLSLVASDPTVAQMEKRPDTWMLPIEGFQAREEIPDSKQVLRYRWGDEISNHRQIERYLHTLSKSAPDRSRLVQYGESYEGRSLNYLVISSPENIARLEQLQTDNLKLSDPRITDADSAAEIIKNAPAFVWLAYCVHGNEISPSDAALLTAYHLLADKRESTRKMLEELVVIIDPLQNPDGRDRFVSSFREARGRFIQNNPYSNEHTERWPGGRANHYWFDMNRDWFRHSQQEVKSKVAAYLKWQPQIYVDAHEMGRNSTFYFPPPTDPKNPYLLDSQTDWFAKLGKHQAGWFDRYRFGYVTREMFDAFYPGYGSEWPTLQGGLGILWEQASARGLVVERNDETELTYRNGVRNHYVSALATLEFASMQRKELLQGFYDARTAAVRLGREGSVKHFFLDRQRPQRSQRLAAMLARNGIEVRTLNEDITTDCHDVFDDQTELRKIPAGSFHIPIAQPTARLLRALLDRQVDMDQKFLRRQLERNQLRLPNEIYDVTAWSMPLAFGVQTYGSGENLDELRSDLWQPKVETPQTDLKNAQVAYLIPGTDGAVRAMSRLIQSGIRFHVADEPFKINGRSYDRGTLIAKVAGNPENLNEQLQSEMLKHGVTDVSATDTAYVDKGAHMGGPDVQWVRPPKVLLVVNHPTNYSSGHTWHLFDQILQYPTTRVNGRDFGGVDLSRFNTIVLPDGRYSTSTGFGKARADELEDWVRNGGTLITLRGATRWATEKDIALLKNQLVKRTVPAVERNDDGDKSDKPEKVTPDSVPGAFFRANVFRKHWVTYGCEDQMDVFYSGSTILAPTTETGGRSLVTFAKKEKLLTSGFCWPTNLELMSETPFVFSRPVGRGNIVAFVDDPNFRAMYPALQRLFINAAMFGAAH